MTKAELVEKMAKEAGISKVSANIALNCIMDEISKSLKKGNKVNLIGFGTFAKVRRKERKGRNFKTGNSIIIKARNVVKFIPGNTLKDALGGGTSDTGPRRK